MSDYRPRTPGVDVRRRLSSASPTRMSASSSQSPSKLRASSSSEPESAKKKIMVSKTTALHMQKLRRAEDKKRASIEEKAAKALQHEKDVSHELATRVQALTHELEMERQKQAVVSDRLHEAREAHGLTNIKCEQLQDDLRAVQRHCEDTVQAMDQKYENLAAELQTALNEKVLLEKLVQEKDMEIEKSHAVSLKSQQLEKDVQHLSYQLENHHELVNAKSAVEQALKAAEARIEAERHKQEEMVRDTKAEVSALTSKHDELVSRLESSRVTQEEALRSRCSQVAVLEERLTSMTDQLAASYQKNEKLEERVQALLDNTKEQDKSLAHAEQTISDLRKSLSQSEIDFRQQVLEAQRSLDVEKTKSHARIEELLGLLASEKSQSAKLLSAKEALDDTIMRFKDETNSTARRHDMDVSKLNESISNLQTHIRQCEEDKATIISDLHRSQRQFDSELADTKATATAALTAVKQSHIVELEAAVESAKRDAHTHVSELNARLREQEEEHEEKLAALQKKIHTATTALEFEKQKNLVASSNEKKLEQSLAERDQELREAHRTAITQKENAATLQARISFLEAELHNAQESTAEQRRSLSEELRQAREHFLEETKSLMEKERATRAQLESLRETEGQRHLTQQGALQSIQLKHAALEDALLSEKSTCKDLRVQIKQLEHEKHNVEEQLQKLRARAREHDDEEASRHRHCGGKVSQQAEEELLRLRVQNTELCACLQKEKDLRLRVDAEKQALQTQLDRVKQTAADTEERHRQQQEEAVRQSMATSEELLEELRKCNSTVSRQQRALASQAAQIVSLEERFREASDATELEARRRRDAETALLEAEDRERDLVEQIQREVAQVAQLKQREKLSAASKSSEEAVKAKLQHQLGESQTMLARCREQIRDQEQKFAVLTAKLEETTHHLEAVTQSGQHRDKAVMAASAEQQARVHSLQEAHSKSMAELTEHYRASVRDVNRLTREVSALTSDNERCHREIEHLKQSLSTQLRAFEELRSEHHSRSQYDDRDKEIHLLRSKLKQEQSSSTATASRLQGTIDSLLTHLSPADTHTHHLQSPSHKTHSRPSSPSSVSSTSKLDRSWASQTSPPVLQTARTPSPSSMLVSPFDFEAAAASLRHTRMGIEELHRMHRRSPN